MINDIISEQYFNKRIDLPDDVVTALISMKVSKKNDKLIFYMFEKLDENDEYILRIHKFSKEENKEIYYMIEKIFSTFQGSYNDIDESNYNNESIKVIVAVMYMFKRKYYSLIREIFDLDFEAVKIENVSDGFDQYHNFILKSTLNIDWRKSIFSDIIIYFIRQSETIDNDDFIAFLCDNVNYIKYKYIHDETDKIHERIALLLN